LGTTVFARRARLLVPGILCLLTSTPVWAETQKLALPQVVEFSLQNFVTGPLFTLKSYVLLSKNHLEMKKYECCL